MLMSKSAKGAPLKVDINGVTVTFNTIDDLKFALDAKTQLPISKYDELRALSLDALKKQAMDIRKVEVRLLQILDDSFDEPVSVDYQLRDMDIRVFSEDHGWRGLIEALNDRDTFFADFKRVVLVKYLQYLANRQDLIKRVYWTKYRETEGAPDASQLPETRDVRETAIFDANELSGLLKEGDTDSVQRLPRGEPVDVRLLPGQEMTLRLSVHPFKMVRADGAYLVDEQGREYPLQSRRSSVGRSTDNDVVVDSAFRAISRKHLIVEFPSKDRVTFTDRSSHGTYLPLRHLAEG